MMLLGLRNKEGSGNQRAMHLFCDVTYLDRGGGGIRISGIQACVLTCLCG